MRICTPLWLLAVVVSLNACAQTQLTEETPIVRVPMGIGYGISDVPCEEFKTTSIPKRVEELEIPFEWTDEEEGLLTVGPINEARETGSVYSTIRQTYYLEVECADELTTSISGEAALEGLNTEGEWIAITDAPTIEQYAKQFLQSLDL